MTSFLSSKRQQSKAEIEKDYENGDPWGYFNNEHDALRKQILLSELSSFTPSRVLDIGCGNGFITESIQAREIIGVDISSSAIEEAQRRSSSGRIEYRCLSLYELPAAGLKDFDCVMVTGVLYEQYIGKSFPLIYRIIDSLLRPEGILVSVHIDSWYMARFPYSVIRTARYKYRKYDHRLEIYRK